MNSISGYELGFGLGLSANGLDPNLMGRISFASWVRARQTAGSWWPAAGPPRELAS
jgi:hypothetical protein